jgi:hypothetical protein
MSIKSDFDEISVDTDADKDQTVQRNLDPSDYDVKQVYLEKQIEYRKRAQKILDAHKTANKHVWDEQYEQRLDEHKKKLAEYKTKKERELDSENFDSNAQKETNSKRSKEQKSQENKQRVGLYLNRNQNNNNDDSSECSRLSQEQEKNTSSFFSNGLFQSNNSILMIFSRNVFIFEDILTCSVNFERL